MAGVCITKNALDSYVCSANSAVKFMLVRKREDLEDHSKVFHPEFTHQFFGDNESIFGYKDLCIKLYYSAARLTTYLGISYSDKVDPQKFDGVQPDNVLQIIDSKLQPGYQSNLDDFVASLAKDTKFNPYGVLVHSFRAENNTGGQFEIYKNGIAETGFCNYHERLQTFLLWFVDAASYIDTDDDKWHFYLVYEVYKNNGDHQYAIAGYATVYHYYAYPSNVRPRISQMLIFPPFQNKGIGTQLLQAIYSQYTSDSHVLDITVEDPSDAFARLRDFVDAKNCSRLPTFQVENIKQGFSKEMVQEAQIQLKLCKRQVRKVYEILRLEATNINDEEDYRSYRLEVKQRLNIPFQKEKSDLDKMKNSLRPEEFRATMQLASVEQRIEQLERLYEDLETQYKHTLERIAASRDE